MATMEDHQKDVPDPSPSQGKAKDIWKEDLKSAIEKGDNVDLVNSLLKNDMDLETSFHYEFPVNDDADDGVTFLMLAAGYDRPEIVQLLLNRKANVLAKTKDYTVTALMYAASQQASIKVVQLLLDKDDTELLAQKDKNGLTALHYAAYSGSADIFAYLLEHGASIKSEADDGATSLHIAAYRGHQKIVEIIFARLDAEFLGDINYITAINEYSRVMRIKKEAMNKKRSFIAAKATGMEGRSALNLAAKQGQISIVYQFLKTPELFPMHPAEEEPYISDRNEADYVTGLLLEAMDEQNSITTESDINSHIEVILYWAILNAQDSLFDRCMAKSERLVQSTENGRSWCTVAALGASNHIINVLLTHKDLQLEWNSRDPTGLLRLAIKNTNRDFVEAFLGWCMESKKPAQDDVGCDSRVNTGEHPLKMLRIFLQSFDDDESNLIALSALGSTDTHRDIERFLWEKLNKSIEDLPTFFDHPLGKDGKSDQEHILELAARFETPRQEKNLKIYLRRLLEKDSQENHEKWNALQLAVYLKLPMVVWWLLSNGGYFNENDLKDAQELTKRQPDQIIREILEDPPPILRVRASGDDHHQPRFQNSKETNFDSPDGTVLDIIQDETEAIFQPKHRSVIDIVYKRGPQEIMRQCKYRKISSVRQAVSNSGLPAGEQGKNYEEGWKEPNLRWKQPDVRWVHIPVNNMHCMDELLVRISRDKGLKNKDHRPLVDFIEKSRTEINCGGKKSQMKPRFVTQMNRNGVEKDCGQVSALYMPYLFWSERPEEFNKGKKNEEFVHDSMTLDQYYYSSIGNTTRRDKDQVVWRFTGGEPDWAVVGQSSESMQELDEDSKAQAVTLNGESTSPQSKQGRVPTILVVHQLWLWVLDRQTIITSTTKEDPDITNSFFQRVLTSIKDQKRTTQWSVEDVREFILSTAIGMFDKAEIWEKSPLEIFRESIQKVRDVETKLFDAFVETLQKDQKDETDDKSSSRGNSQSTITRFQKLWKFLRNCDSSKSEPSEQQREKESSYDNILRETELLREIKDICDELNMLKILAEDQKEVCDKLLDKEHNPNISDTPSEITARIEEMMEDAKFVRDSIDTLLDLKQKQANITEAKNSRKRSEETAKQGVAIMVFTLVTIAFLPASFLTSLFALNVSDFPHSGGTVSYEGRWIFPIIFGISTGVSLIIAIIAFRMAQWRDWWRSIKSNTEKTVRGQPNMEIAKLRDWVKVTTSNMTQDIEKGK